MNNTERVAQHHREQFGDTTITQKATKLLEECGELAGAIIRHVERRDGHTWVAQASNEIGDVLIVLHSICHHYGFSLNAIDSLAVMNFVDRTWDNITPGSDS